jgi:putative oxidoreductase
MFRFFASTNSFLVDLGLLLLRLSSGLLMMTHGWAKWTGFAEYSASFADPLRIGSTASLVLTIFAEFFCALFLALGLFTRGVLVPLIILTLVIVFMVHGNYPLGKKEHGLLFLFPYILIFFAGPGKYSVDRLIKKA